MQEIMNKEELIKKLIMMESAGLYHIPHERVANFILENYCPKSCLEPIKEALKIQWEDSDDRWTIANRLTEAIESTLIYAT